MRLQSGRTAHKKAHKTARNKHELLYFREYELNLNFITFTLENELVHLKPHHVAIPHLTTWGHIDLLC